MYYLQAHYFFVARSCHVLHTHYLVCTTFFKRRLTARFFKLVAFTFVYGGKSLVHSDKYDIYNNNAVWEMGILRTVLLLNVCFGMQLFISWFTIKYIVHRTLSTHNYIYFKPTKCRIAGMQFGCVCLTILVNHKSLTLLDS